MPASQGRVCKLFLCNNFSSLPLLSHIFQTSRSTVPLLISRRFSSVDGSITGNGGGGEGVAGRASDDIFSGGGRSNSYNDDGRGIYDSHQNPPEPIPNRILRGEKRNNHQSEHLSRNDQPSFREGNRGRGQSGRDGFSNNEHDDDDDGNVNGGFKMEDVDENKMSKAKPFQSSALQFLNKSLSEENGDGQSEDKFLDKFKLGFDKKGGKPVQSANDTQLPREEGKPKPEQPPPEADEIFKKMKENGLIPNAVAMLDGLCKDGLVQEAMKLFGLMREKGTIPEVVIYTAVVEGFFKAQKPDDAKRIFRKMQKNGISPNAFSYTVLIQGFCKCNRLEDAIDFTVEMLEAGHSPNVATFVTLVDCSSREKGVEEAKAVIGSLRQKGFFLDEKIVREFLDRKAPSLPLVWEAIFGKKISQNLF